MSMRRGRVEGKVALVTGGNGGIGQAIALRLGEEGARVVLSDLDVSADLLEGLAKRGIEAMAVTLDVRDESSWQQAVAQTLARFGALDILVNNAGIALPPPDGFEAITLADWRRVMSVNLDGVFLGMKHAVLAMRERGGSIVNIGSVAAYVGTPGGAAYGTSKGALRTLARQAAVACAKKGYRIRINTVHPMYIWTPLLAAAGKSKEVLRDMHPFKQLGEPDDVAYAVLYLASDEARLVNASDLVVDGAQLST